MSRDHANSTMNTSTPQLQLQTEESRPTSAAHPVASSSTPPPGEEIQSYPPATTNPSAGPLALDHLHGQTDTSIISTSSDEENFVKLFIGQIPKNLEEESLRPFFEEFGPVVEFSVIRDKATRQHKGCAFVTYANQQSAFHAIHSLHDKVKLPNAVNPLQIREADSLVEKENKIFVGMLPKTWTESDIQELFGRFGPLKEIHIIRGPDGHTKGCAFVKYLDRESALEAIQELNDTIPEGSTRPLVIKLADSRRTSHSFDDGNSAVSGAEVRDYWMSQQISSFSPSDPTGNSSQGQYPQSPMMPHSPMNSGMPVPYMSYAPSNPGAPSPHVAPSYMFYHGFYTHDTNNTPTSPPSNMGVMSMSPTGPVMYQLPTASLSPPHSNNRSFMPMPDERQTPTGYSQHHSQEKPEGPTRQVEGPVGANLFIYHLPRDLTDADLATLFAPFGDVLSAKVFMDKKTAESKGFGFVSFNSVSAAEAAIGAMNGFQIGSKRLKVQHKRVGGYNEPMLNSSLPRGSSGSRNDLSGYPSAMPINMPFYHQSPYVAVNGSDSMYSQHPLMQGGMAHSPTVGITFLQSPYGSQPIPAQYMSYHDDAQRRVAATAYPPPPPMYMNQSPPSRPYYQSHPSRAAAYDPNSAVHLSQSFQHSLRLNPEGGN